VNRTSFGFSSAPVFFLLLAGCGAPGEPLPPRPPIPTAINDLAARQIGETVHLDFSLPRKTIEGDPLTEPPAIEIYRGFVPAGASPGKTATRLVYTIPSALVNTVVRDGHVEFTDHIAPDELRAHSGEQILYGVRTRASQKRASADSNTVFVEMHAVPEQITEVRAVVTETAVELSWRAPTRVSFGNEPVIAVYRIYRAEVDPASAAPPPQDLAKAKSKAPLTLFSEATNTNYRDTKIEFGKTYLYSVRSVVLANSSTVESADSVPAIVTPRDTFAPAAPQKLVAVFVPALPDVAAHIELSWGISPETDLAGYYVYRSEQETERGDHLTRDLLLAPTFRDMSVVPGHRYTYYVTAVDRAGNESIASAAVSIEVPQYMP
jgi:hypothetical protein